MPLDSTCEALSVVFVVRHFPSFPIVFCCFCCQFCCQFGRVPSASRRTCCLQKDISSFVAHFLRSGNYNARCDIWGGVAILFANMELQHNNLKAPLRARHRTMSNAHKLLLIRTLHTVIYLILATSVVFVLVAAFLGYLARCCWWL